jgi:bacillithiol synthase
MFKTTHVDFKSAGTLNKLVFDYLSKDAALKPFYEFYPDIEGFRQLLNTNPYNHFDRTTLSTNLLQQSRSVKNTHDLSIKNIERFKDKKTYCVTTGHQLCLFTGPLYFIYKIFSTINLAETLKKEFPEFDFVPVYWMASEDHDFEEVSSFNTHGKTLKWQSAQNGAVGLFKTAELKKILPELRDALGISTNANYLYQLFEKSYLQHGTLADATRYLVNELFGQYGLVTIDGNDVVFKTQIKNLLKTDIFESTPAQHVLESIKKLEALGYHAQVNPRLVNSFYLGNNLRARLEKNGEDYKLVGTEQSFTKKELEQIIEKSPELMSPNVVLRPMYQQLVLPNIAYVGGPGELAYWLEFKQMFEALNVFYPILMPRNFFSIVDRSVKQKIDQTKFTESDFFKSEQDLIKVYMQRNDLEFDLNEETEKMRTLYADILMRTEVIDKTISGNVNAEKQKSLNRLGRIVTKTNKALKKRSETELNRIKIVKQWLFPNGSPQERFENFSSMYIKHGPAFFDIIKNETDVFLQTQKIIIES